ncbi:hypothetical protein SAZ11_36950 [Streptomyces sp. FXJ1.4098]|nr:hypothetical protein [Streptomyces sp. FXJ1.4098]
MALAFVVAILFTAPSDTAEGATTPQDLMRGERIAALVTLLVIAPLIGISVGLEFWTESGSWAVLSGTAAWVGAAAILLLVSPWSRWTLARTSMALTGRAPWSLMRFLRDAHRQGVLRQTGGPTSSATSVSRSGSPGGATTKQVPGPSPCPTGVCCRRPASCIRPTEESPSGSSPLSPIGGPSKRLSRWPLCMCWWWRCGEGSTRCRSSGSRPRSSSSSGSCSPH